MKRDWDVIREVLIEIEELSDNPSDRGSHDRGQKVYEIVSGQSPDDIARNAHALLLWKAGYVEAIDASSMDGEAIISPDLTWAGHDLLDTLRSKPVWDRIKKTAKDSGIELTFEAVKMLGKSALEWVLAQAR